jgi:hypothetical protein
MGQTDIKGCGTMTEIEYDQLVDIVIAKVRAQRQYLQLKELLDTAVEKELGPIKASITAKLSADQEIKIQLSVILLEINRIQQFMHCNSVVKAPEYEVF